MKTIEQMTEADWIVLRLLRVLIRNRLTADPDVHKTLMWSHRNLPVLTSPSAIDLLEDKEKT